VAELQDAARSSSLAAVGIVGDLRVSLGMQAVGALAHLAQYPGGAAAAVAAPASHSAIALLLGAKHEEARLATAMLLSVVASNGGTACR
jgi:hypothetical protein